MDANEALTMEDEKYEGKEELIERLKARLKEFKENERKGKVYTLEDLRKIGYDV